MAERCADHSWHARCLTIVADHGARMKILLTNHDLNHYAGTETFTYALATELNRSGHEVICFSPRLGAVAQRLAATGIAVTRDLSGAPDDIDVIHAHHRYESLLAFARYPDRPMIFTCHGVQPWQEQPIRVGLTVSRYVAVSEEVRDHLVQRHGVADENITIIRNGLDLDRFHSRSPIGARPSRALVLSNYMRPDQRERVRRVCARLGITVREAGARQSLWAVEDEINLADIIFALGRSALEAMACRRLVVVYDYNGGDGLVTPERFERLRQRNFSGRTFRRYYSDAELATEISAYDRAIADQVYSFIERDHDVRKMTQQFLALYEEARLSIPRQIVSVRDVAVRQYGALAGLLDDVATLRTAAAGAEGSLNDIRQSRSWRALAGYRKLKAGLRIFRRRQPAARLRARILVVDDDPLIGQWLTEVLTADGHTLEAVDNARSGLERLRAATFDLVLTDLRMPEVDGIELYQTIERTEPRMAQRVIFVTGAATEPRYQQFLAGLGARNLAKPFDVIDLTRLIHRTLNPSPH